MSDEDRPRAGMGAALAAAAVLIAFGFVFGLMVGALMWR